MALSHLIDTSVLTRLGEPTVVDAIRELLQDGVAARAIISDLEIGFSARNGRAWDELHDALEICAPIEVLPADFTRAQGIQRSLADAGLRGRKLPDLLIAAAAERHRLTVVHYVRDYDHVSTVTGQSTQWVVPAGTID